MEAASKDKPALPKELSKESPKESPKELPKELPYEPSKDKPALPKEPLKEPTKDKPTSPKEPSKEIKEKEPKPTIQDASKDSPSTPSLSTKKDPPVQKEKPPFSMPVILSPHKKSETKKPDSTFIKVDYLKPAKSEKSKESVTRVLDFANGVAVSSNGTLADSSNGTLANGVKVEATEKKFDDTHTVKVEKEEPLKPLVVRSPVKHEKDESRKHSVVQSPAKITKSEISQSVIKIEKEVEPKPSTSQQTEETPIKKEPTSSSKHPSSTSKHHRSSSHHKSSHTSSSHHKSSSSSGHKSSSSSRKDCSRCYRRSKIKKSSVGVQVRPDETNVPKPPTRPLEFEASHRVGVNRRPIAINTNLSYLKYGRFYHIEVHPNGGASIVHMYQDELDTLNPEQMAELVEEFFELVFSEDDNGYAFHVMGVVHDGARYLPDLLEHMAENYSNLTVKSGVIGRNNDIETCTMTQYYEQVMKNYDEGTVRHGPLHQISLVGKVHEEVGGYFPDLIGKLEKSPFLRKSMPWGKMSIVQMDPRLSNDGPILWIRPGEQLIPTAEMAKTPLKRQRARINELRNLQYLPRASEAREIMFEDRTKAHADHVGMGHERQTTAAVGKFEKNRESCSTFKHLEFLETFKVCVTFN